MDIEKVIKKIEYNKTRVRHLETEYGYIENYNYVSGEMNIGVTSRGNLKLEVTNADILKLIKKEINSLNNETKMLREQLAKQYGTLIETKKDNNGTNIILIAFGIIFLLAVMFVK